MTRSMMFKVQSVLFLIASATSVGCVVDGTDTPIYILYNKAPNDEGKISAEDDGRGIAAGLIDVQWGYPYTWNPLMGNFASAMGTIDIEQRIAFVEGADIELAVDDDLFSEAEQAAFAAANFTRFSDRFSTVVYPNGGKAVIAGAQLVPYALLDAMRDKIPAGSGRTQIKATAKLFGTMAGSQFTSRGYVYWVTVCNGCAASPEY